MPNPIELALYVFSALSAILFILLLRYLARIDQLKDELADTREDHGDALNDVESLINKRDALQSQLNDACEKRAELEALRRSLQDAAEKGGVVIDTATELIFAIMRDEVNAQDECEKWLRDYAPAKLREAYIPEMKVTHIPAPDCTGASDRIDYSKPIRPIPDSPEPSPLLAFSELWDAMRLLEKRIELCGYSRKTESAIELATGIRRAVGAPGVPSDRSMVSAVRELLAGGTPSDSAPGYPAGFATGLAQVDSGPVNHPKHYNSLGAECECGKGIECIQVAENFTFALGNAIKYIWRAGKKSDDSIEDLKKANWYVESEIKRLEKQRG